MVIHEDVEMPIEVPVTTKRAPTMHKRYVTMKNHIREVVVSDETQKEVSESVNNIHSNSVESSHYINKSPLFSQESTTYFNKESSSDVNKSDLEELISVYKKCKRIVKKIESKYGHLLDLDDDETQQGENESKKRKRKFQIIHCDQELETETRCTCTVKKKIVFNENGEQVHLSPSLSNHICYKKVKNIHKNYIKIADCEKIKNNETETTQWNDTSENLQVELEESESLPDDIVTLSKLLQNNEISTPYRKKIIDKMKMLTQQQNYELHFWKQTLIKQSKDYPEGVIEFKGSNLCSLPGYLEL